MLLSFLYLYPLLPRMPQILEVPLIYVPSAEGREWGGPLPTSHFPPSASHFGQLGALLGHVCALSCWKSWNSHIKVHSPNCNPEGHFFFLNFFAILRADSDPWAPKAKSYCLSSTFVQQSSFLGSSNPSSLSLIFCCVDLIVSTGIVLCIVLCFGLLFL